MGNQLESISHKRISLHLLNRYNRNERERNPHNGSTQLKISQGSFGGMHHIKYYASCYLFVLSWMHNGRLLCD